MSAKKPTIYIHIGTIKTGTTSLQHFFHINRTILTEKFNIYYPKAAGIKNHTKLPLYAYYENIKELRTRHQIFTKEDIDKFRVDFKPQLLKELKTQIEKGKNILFSCEHLSSRAMKPYEINNLKDLFLELETNFKIIVYLRRQDQMMLSTYSTWVKSGGHWQLNPNAYKNRRYDHLSMLNLWSTCFGKENIIVRAFDKTRMLNEDLLCDFLSIFKIASTESFVRPKNNKLNSSLDEAQVQFLSIFNKFIPAIKEGKQNPDRGKLIKFLEEFTVSPRLSLNIDQKKKILSYFESDNKIIEDTYLKDGSKLFDSKIGEEEFYNPTPLTPEKAIEIAAHLWLRQQEIIKKNTTWYKKLYHRIKSI